MKNVNVEKQYTDGTQKLNRGIKRYIFDIIAAVIILAIIAATLHIFDVYDMSNPEEIKSFFVDWVPYFLASILLNGDLYEKGIFVGKSVKEYIDAKHAYSEKVSTIDGHKLSKVTDFCIYYNTESLISLRKAILKEQGLSYEQFDKEYKTKDATYPGLKTWTEEKLKSELTSEQVDAVLQAKKVKVKGINTNLLLGNEDVNDPTNIGLTEKQLTMRRNIWITIRYLFMTGLMSVLFIKDITKWRWGGLLEVLFKLTFVVARALMSYLKGYTDTVVHHTNHLIRKTDILQIFDVWYDKNYPNGENTSEVSD